MGIRGDGRDDRWRMGRKSGAVSTGVRWESQDRGWSLGRVLESISYIQDQYNHTYDFDSTIPGTGEERVLRYHIPRDRIDLASMFLPLLNRKVTKSNVKHLDRSIPTPTNELVLMGFGPRSIVKGILSLEPDLLVSDVPI